MIPRVCVKAIQLLVLFLFALNAMSAMNRYDVSVDVPLNQLIVTDDLDSTEDLLNITDWDDPSERILVIRFHLERDNYTQYHLYARIDRSNDDAFIGWRETSEDYFEWKADADPNIYHMNPAFDDGPEFGHAYQFTIYGIWQDEISGQSKVDKISSDDIVYFDEALPTPTPTEPPTKPDRFDFSNGDEFTVMGAGFDTYPRAEIEYGAIPTDHTFEDATDGVGAIITADPGEGLMIFGPTIETENAAMIRCSVRSDAAHSAITIATVGQDSPVFISTHAASDGSYYVNQYKRLSTFFVPPSTGFQPLIQIVNTSEDDPLTVYLDNFDVYLFDIERFYHAEFLNNDELDPARLSVPENYGITTPTPIPTHTSPPLPTSTPTLTPTDTPYVSPTPTLPKQGGETIVIEIPNLSEDVKPLEMVYVPAGAYLMGSPENEQERLENEGPQHQVILTKGFYISKYLITQAQWEAVMGKNPSFFGGDENLPVESVNWYDCLEFIQNLNDMGLGEFRLPREAEWEHACRAGTATRYYWGNDPTYEQIDAYAWNWYNSYGRTRPVGEKKPNNWGIYDMSGGCYEWCHDWYGPYETSSKTDPDGPVSGDSRVIRGGFWNGDPVGCRSAARGKMQPFISSTSISLRLVMVDPEYDKPVPESTETPIPALSVPQFGASIQSYASYEPTDDDIDEMNADNQTIIRYFAKETFRDNIDMVLKAQERGMKMIMLFGCGNLHYGIDCDLHPLSCSDCWWNLDLIAYDQNTDEYERRYTCDPEGYADWAEYRLEMIELAVPGAIGSTLIGVQLGNEEEEKWGYLDGNCFYAGQIFADYYLTARERIKTRWPNLPILSGSVESHRSLDFITEGVSSSWKEDNGRTGLAFLNGFIQKIIETADGSTELLPEIIAINGYPGIAPPEYLHEGEGTKEWIERLDTLDTICHFYDYYPRYAVSEYGLSPNPNSVYGCADADERTQGIYYLRTILMDATMQSESGSHWDYCLYWVHHYNGDTSYDTGWFRTAESGSDRVIRTIGQALHSSGAPEDGNLGLNEEYQVWIPAQSDRREDEDPEKDNTMTCGWTTADGDKWGAIWRYKNNVSDFYIASPETAQFTVKQENPGKAHLYKFIIGDPPRANNTRWVQITEEPIEGRRVIGTAGDTVYNLPASITHSLYGEIDVTNENPVFLHFYEE